MHDMLINMILNSDQRVKSSEADHGSLQTMIQLVKMRKKMEKKL